MMPVLMFTKLGKLGGYWDEVAHILSFQEPCSWAPSVNPSQLPVAFWQELLVPYNRMAFLNAKRNKYVKEKGLQK